MPRISRSQYALLGILSFGPKSGYEIRKLIESSIGFFWQESYGQIYPMLERLRSEKAVDVKEVEQKGRPDKKIYSLTEEGEAKLKSWLAADAQKQPLRDELLLKVFFGGLTDPGNLIRILQNENFECREKLKIFQNIKKELDVCSHENVKFSIFTLNYGIEYMKMQSKWCEKTIQEIQKEEK
ncbi:MAG: PadR family transcriptional regulator [Spirochaetia bacterium]|nr:PadR family transcriptional regulator [Spirochaetia bacterium]